MIVHTVADCMNEISKIKSLISRYELAPAMETSTVLFEGNDTRKVYDCLTNYKELLMELEVKHILLD